MLRKRTRSVGGEPTKRQYAVRGVYLLAAVAALMGVLAMSMNGAFMDASRVSVTLDTVGGAIVPNADVKMHGLPVGKVKEVEGGRGAVRLELAIDNDDLGGIPRTAVARVLPATAFGTTYVDLVAPGARPGGPSLRAGDTIEQDESQPTLELQKALDSIDELVTALGPAELNTTLTALAMSVDGRGEQLGTSIRRLNNVVGQLTPEMPLVREDLALLATNLQTVQRTAPDLLAGVEDTLVVANHLVQKRAMLTRFLSGGLNLVRDTDRFLAENERKLVRAIVGAAITTDAVYDNRSGIGEQIAGLNTLLSRLQTVTDGGAVRINAYLVGAGSFTPYTPADCPRYGTAAGRNCGGAAARPSLNRLMAGALLEDRKGASR